MLATCADWEYTSNPTGWIYDSCCSRGLQKQILINLLAKASGLSIHTQWRVLNSLTENAVWKGQVNK